MFSNFQSTPSQPSAFGLPLNSGVALTSSFPLNAMTNTNPLAPQPQTQPQPQPQGHGLGGPIIENDASSATSNANKSIKESSLVPPELVPIVDSLKKFIKDQKTIREENSQSKFSIQPIVEVGSELDESLKVSLHQIEMELQRNARTMDVLKQDTNKLLSNAEMAYRLSRMDIPSSASSYSMAQNQYINKTTHEYFVEIVNSFEEKMKRYADQIASLQTHLDNMNKPYHTHELFQIMRKQHDTLVSLAAQVYTLHDHVNKLKRDRQVNVSSQRAHAAAHSCLPNVSTQSTHIGQEHSGPNPFALSGDTPVHVMPTTTHARLGLSSTLPSSSSISNSIIQSSSFQPTSNPNSISPNSHSRSKRWTTS